MCFFRSLLQGLKYESFNRHGWLWLIASEIMHHMTCIFTCITKICKNPVVNHRRFSAATGSPDLVLFGGGYSPLCSEVPWGDPSLRVGWIFWGNVTVNFIKNINHHLVKFFENLPWTYPPKKGILKVPETQASSYFSNPKKRSLTWKGSTWNPNQPKPNQASLPVRESFNRLSQRKALGPRMGKDTPSDPWSKRKHHLCKGKTTSKIQSQCYYCMLYTVLIYTPLNESRHIKTYPMLLHLSLHTQLSHPSGPSKSPRFETGMFWLCLY